MPKLKGPQQAFIVACLACYDTPSEVAEQFRETFGFDVERGHVWNYDASKPLNRERMRTELVRLFDETRRKFLDDVEGVAIANKAVRLREIQKLYDRAKERGAVVVAADLLEQAAKEVGNVFTNRRDLTSGGQAIKALIEVDIDEV